MLYTNTIAKVKSEYDFTVLHLNIPASLQTKQSADAHLAEAQYWHGQLTLNIEVPLKIPSRNSTPHIVSYKAGQHFDQGRG